jgi:hypothetical protein
MHICAVQQWRHLQHFSMLGRPCPRARHGSEGMLHKGAQLLPLTSAHQVWYQYKGL